MRDRIFSLTDHLSDFIDRQVEEGRHRDASEVVCEALRRYEDDLADKQASLAAIKAAADRGIAEIERGEFLLVTSDGERHSLLDDLNRRADGRA